MLKLQNVALALVLSAPFGLAIHDEITKKTPSIDDLQANPFGDSLYGDYGDYYDDGHVELGEGIQLNDEELDELFRQYQDDMGEEPEQELPELTPDALSKLFGTEPATLGSTLSDIRFGMSHTQVLAVVPNIESFSLDDPDTFPGVAVYPEYTNEANTRLSTINVTLRDPNDMVMQHLLATWGVPRFMGEEQGFIAWIGADGHTRAVFASTGGDLREIRFDKAMTMQEFFAKPSQGKGIFSFENQQPILGASFEALAANYDDVVANPFEDQYQTLEIPGIVTDPEARGPLEVELTLHARKVTHIVVSVPCQDEGCTDVLAAVRQRFGKSLTPVTADNEYGDITLRVRKSPSITIDVFNDERMAEIIVTNEED